jgi:hypothetical protein
MRLTFCVLCGEDDQSTLEHHHYIPESMGGSDDESNMMTLCGVCHGKVHHIPRPMNLRDLIRAGRERAQQERVHERELLNSFSCSKQSARITDYAGHLWVSYADTHTLVGKKVRLQVVPDTAHPGMWRVEGTTGLRALTFHQAKEAAQSTIQGKFTQAELIQRKSTQGDNENICVLKCEGCGKPLTGLRKVYCGDPCSSHNPYPLPNSRRWRDHAVGPVYHPSGIPAFLRRAAI